ncbi:MAG: type II secretion system protein GspK [Candidatus Aureabacteria bacterium]|nr:type II secretion system protein GspK [Candidatus Auribacterota bacterium]
MNSYNKHCSEAGVVLVVVAFFIVVLSILVLQFGYLARLDARMASNFRDATEASALARAGVAQAIALLQDDALDDEKGDEEKAEGADPTPPPRRGRRMQEPAQEKKDEKGKDDLSEGWAQVQAPVKLGGGVFVFTIVDEDRKFNLNLLADEAVAEVEGKRQKLKAKEEEQKEEGEEKTAGQKLAEKKDAGWTASSEEKKEGEEDEVKETKINEEIQEKLVALFDDLGLSGPKDLVKNIIDWIDADDDGDAEENSYSLLDPAYRCRNAPLETIGELALIKDFGPKILDGERVREEIPEAKEGEVETRPPEEDTFPGLRRYLTVYSDGLVNVNTAPEEVLRIWLGEDQADLAEAIVSAREEKPFGKTDEIKEAIEEDIPSKVLEKFKVQSSYFSILSEGRVGRVASRLRAVVQRLPDEIRIVYWRYES